MGTPIGRIPWCDLTLDHLRGARALDLNDLPSAHDPARRAIAQCSGFVAPRLLPATLERRVSEYDFGADRHGETVNTV